MVRRKLKKEKNPHHHPFLGCPLCYDKTLTVEVSLVKGPALNRQTLSLFSSMIANSFLAKTLNQSLGRRSALVQSALLSADPGLEICFTALGTISPGEGRPPKVASYLRRDTCVTSMLTISHIDRLGF
ncbi:hypothetical protein CB1_000995055 [Camelus ferus]|nr:hypothetical protein CB1_000995055 [Camelus ferus]